MEQKTSVLEVAGKLEFFDIELRQNYGLLEDDYASG